MVKLESYWNSNRDWFHFEGVKRVINNDALDEAKRNYQIYLKQLLNIDRRTQRHLVIPKNREGMDEYEDHDPDWDLGSFETESLIVKSRKRVADFGEVYTNEREVNNMLDLVKEETQKITSTFLEPACGNGNFLVEILRRKLSSVARQYSSDMDAYRIHMIEAVASIYGVDIQADNVQESRRRLLDICNKEYAGSFGINLSDGVVKALECVMERNIVCGNTLTCLFNDGRPLVFSEWKLNEDGLFERRDYLFSDILENKDESINGVPITYDWRSVA